MILIKHIIFVDLDAERKLLINSLNGLVDVVDLKTYGTIYQCQQVKSSNDILTTPSLRATPPKRGIYENRHPIPLFGGVPSADGGVVFDAYYIVDFVGVARVTLLCRFPPISLHVM